MSRHISVTPAIASVIAERVRQDAKWGEQNHDLAWWLAILVEEVGEVARQVLLDNVETIACRNELIHVAAVAVAAIEALDRRREVPS